MIGTAVRVDRVNVLRPDSSTVTISDCSFAHAATLGDNLIANDLQPADDWTLERCNFAHSAANMNLRLSTTLWRSALSR